MEAVSTVLRTNVQQAAMESMVVNGVPASNGAPSPQTSAVSLALFQAFCQTFADSLNRLVVNATQQGAGGQEGAFKQEPQQLAQKFSEILTRVLRTAEGPQGEARSILEPVRATPVTQAQESAFQKDAPPQRTLSTLQISNPLPFAATPPAQQNNQLPLGFIVPFIPPSKLETYPAKFKRKKNWREEILEEQELLRDKREEDEDESEESPQ